MVAGRLTKDGTLQLAGSLDTRSPARKDGLVVHYPLDGSLNKIQTSLSGIKVLCVRYGNVDRHWTDYFQAQGAVMTYVTTTAFDTITVTNDYDLVLVDMYVWAVTTTHMNKIKEFVDIGVSAVATGNDTGTNVFVSSRDSAPHAGHSISFDSNNLLSGTATIGGGSGDLNGGITGLQNGAIPLHYRIDSGDITGYTYTGPTDAMLYFDQEGNSTVHQYTHDMFLEALNVSKGRTTYADSRGLKATDVSKYVPNLYADGQYKNGNAPVFGGGDWRYNEDTDVTGPNGQSVAKVFCDNLGNGLKYNGRDITLVVDTIYTSSCWCYVSEDFNGEVSTDVMLRGEHGFGYTSYYDYSRKGTWQFLTRTGKATTTNARILPYVHGTSATKGVVYFTDVQFTQSKFVTNYQEYGYTKPDTDIEMNFPVSSNCTIIGKFKPYSAWSNSPNNTPDYLETDNQSALIGIHNDDKSGNIYYRYYQDGSGVSHPFLDPDGTFGTAHVHTDTTYTTDELWYKIKYDGTNLKIQIKQNGVWKNEHASNIGSGGISKITLGKQNGTIWGGKHSDISIYNGLILNTDADKIIAKKLSVTAGGGVIPTISGTLVPENAAFFPLSTDGNSIGKSVYPEEDTSTVYGDGVFIGRGTTNLITKPFGPVDAHNNTLDGVVIVGPSGNPTIALKYDGSGDGYSPLNLTVPGAANTSFSVSYYIKSDIPCAMLSSSYLQEHGGGYRNISGTSFTAVTTEWQKVVMTNVAPSDCIDNLRLILRPPSDTTATIYYSDIQIIKSTYEVPFTTGTRGQSTLRLPYSTIDCKTDFTIMGWWKPMVHGDGVYRPCITRNLNNANSTGHRILVMGNSTNKELRSWHGSGGNTESAVYIGSSVLIETNEWNFFCFRRVGADIRLTLGNSTGFKTSSSTTASLLSTDEDPNTQSWHIGEYADSESDAYHRDYSFIQSGLSDTEVEDIFKSKMKMTKDGLQINQIETSISLV